MSETVPSYSASSGGMPSGRRHALAWAGLFVAIGLVGWAIRFQLLYRNGLLNLGTYDDGVHFASAVNLIHGRLPYRDVLFLQPPGITLAATPFAALAPLIGDPRAFILAKIAFTAIGGLNAVVVAAVLRRFGPAAAVTGGALYAITFPAVYDERTMTLEPLATLGLLVGLLLLPIAAERRSTRWFLVAGFAAGAAMGFKIWYIVPFLVLLVFARGGRLRFLLGGVIAGLAIYLPFFVAAPAKMWQEVVLAQLGRPDLAGTPTEARLRSMIGISGTKGTTALGGFDPNLLLWLLVALAVVLTGVALLERRAWVFVVLLATGTAVLLAAPSYFQHYAVLTTFPLCLIAGVATARILRPIPVVWPRAVVVALIVAALVPLNADQDRGSIGTRPPLAGLQAAAKTIHGCIISDDPGLLAGMNVLTKEVAAGCDIHSDPSGISYTVARRVVHGVPVGRDANPVFQREMVDYLLSGVAYLNVRQHNLKLTPANLAILARGRLVYSKDGYRLRLTPH